MRFSFSLLTLLLVLPVVAIAADNKPVVVPADATAIEPAVEQNGLKIAPFYTNNGSGKQGTGKRNLYATQIGIDVSASANAPANSFVQQDWVAGASVIFTLERSGFKQSGHLACVAVNDMAHCAATALLPVPGQYHVNFAINPPIVRHFHAAQTPIGTNGVMQAQWLFDYNPTASGGVATANLVSSSIPVSTDIATPTVAIVHETLWERIKRFFGFGKPVENAEQGH